MMQKKLLQFLLSPFSLLYGVGVSMRNWMYRQGLLKSVSFDLPVVSVGNLSVGGAGKTPHIEYLIRLLKDYLEVATLSRGYMRKTKGFRVVQYRDNARQTGDEPLQFKRKFPDLLVTVSESRMFGVPQILSQKPSTQVILLDDAFQHLAVRPGLNILLTEYNRPFTRDFLLPSGRLREWRSAYERADVVVVSKCPPELSEAEARELREEIQPLPHQQLFFSYYQYGTPYFLFNRRYGLKLNEEWTVLVICAIANTDYLLSYLNQQVGEVRVLEFEDHHYFTKEDLSALKKSWDKLETDKKVIITTEKDAMRMEEHRAFLQSEKLPVFVLPIEVQFLFEQGPAFDEHIKQFLLDFKA